MWKAINGKESMEEENTKKVAADENGFELMMQRITCGLSLTNGS